MLSSGEFKPNKEGEYFIDRSPNSFGLLLEYLRSGFRVPTEHLPEYKQVMLTCDVDFYQINSFFTADANPLFTFQTDDDPTVEVSRGGTMLTITQRRTDAKYYTATFAPVLERFAIAKWKITVSRTAVPQEEEELEPGRPAWGWSSVGIGNAESPRNGNVIDVDLVTGDLHTPFDDTFAYINFVDWLDDSPERVVECCLNKQAWQFSISCLGITRSFKLSPQAAVHPVPIVWCGKDTQGMVFTISSM
eukprot:TRINITY_DN52232_c0_g1_i3.p1 TRINITY_DN52232_c0_g1~~TRINITY_DN52232_c0_g1_i3.p1  ORF type:complete len:247 (+),score=26.30 TRINITY_DN52232_c0_g1_i3:325-1065(+)